MTDATCKGPVRAGETRTAILVDKLNRTQIVQYSGASGDFNPLHTDELFATNLGGQSSVIAHGMLTMGMAGRMVTDWFGADSVVSFSSRFIGIVLPGDSLSGTAVIEAIREDGDARLADIAITVCNQDGKTVMTSQSVARLA